MCVASGNFTVDQFKLSRQMISNCNAYNWWLASREELTRSEKELKEQNGSVDVVIARRTIHTIYYGIGGGS